MLPAGAYAGVERVLRGPAAIAATAAAARLDGGQRAKVHGAQRGIEAAVLIRAFLEEYKMPLENEQQVVGARVLLLLAFAPLTAAPGDLDVSEQL